mgnify:CR=1 FL=1
MSETALQEHDSEDLTDLIGNPSVEVIRVRNPAAINMGPIREVLEAGFSNLPLIEDIESVIQEIASFVHHEGVGLFMVHNDSRWEGFALCQWGFSALSPYCSVLHFYNRGGEEHREALRGAVVDYAREGGYTTIVGMDINGKPRAFQRLFGRGYTADFRGEVYAFNIGSDP